ncbi:MAG: urease subunit beta [Ilumatobacteraceae bacterium]|nr:urease subunit beta [Ilumatobacteraceae bacterium]
MIPGEISGPEGTLVLNAGAIAVEITVMNAADRPIQVGSHYHFAESNPGLQFDRGAAYGRRLDIPAGTSVRFEPGIGRTVALIPLGGARIVAGLRNQVAGPLDRPASAESGAS